MSDLGILRLILSEVLFKIGNPDTHISGFKFCYNAPRARAFFSALR